MGHDAGARRRRWMPLVPLVFACAGALFATSATTAHGTDLRAGERANLADLVREEARQVEEQSARLAEVRAQVDALSQAAAERDTRVGAAVAGTSAVEQAAHLRPVAGPAVRVTLSDAPPTDPAQLPEGAGVDSLVVHQQDLQAVVNALWAGGAEAMQLMDQRVISTSAVRCVGNVLILQGRTYPPPYVVTAVGDVDAMQAALDAAPAVQQYRYWVDLVGIGYEVETLDEAELPAYEGALELVHARVPDDAR